MDESKIVGIAKALNSSNAYRTVLQSQQHELIADEPVTAGGSGEGPAPGDYLCMSLAACKAITLRMYVQRKQWDVGEIHVKVSLLRANTAEGPVHTFMCQVSASGNLTAEQKERLLQIEKMCPVSKLLSKGANVVSAIE